MFGGAELAPKRLGEPEEDPAQPGGQFTLTPKVGVQFQSYEEESVTYYAVRYVAAVSLTSLDGVTASWTRGVSEKNSNPIKTLSGSGHNSTVLYASLNNGGSPKAATSETGGEYKNYLVYSLYGIPADQAESYVAAYLTLSDGVHTPVKSKAVVAQLNGSNYFSLSADANGYFLKGTVEGVDDLVWLNDPATGSNHAQKRGPLEANDNFGVFKLTPSEFKFYGNSACGYEHFYMVGDNSVHQNYTKVRLSGEYTFYMNGDDNFGIEPEDVKIDLYLDTGVWDSGNTERYAVHTSDDSGWISMTEVTSQKLYKIHNFNVADHPKFYLCRMNGDGSHDTNEWGNRWNQTAEITFEYNNGNPLENKFVIDNWDGDGEDAYHNKLSGYHRASHTPVQVVDPEP